MVTQTHNDPGHPNILVTGMTSLRQGAMESDNLGNYVIIEPLFRSLREYFGISHIRTTLQLSSTFLKRYNVDCLSDSTYFEYRFSNSVQVSYELLLAIIWRCCNSLGVDAKALFKRSPRLQAIKKSDIIIDFSGDMYGDNALNWHHYLLGVVTPLLSKLLGKKIYFIASSPGPFKSILRLVLAKLSLQLFDIVAVRDPVSLHILNGIGLVGEKYCCHPCFSYGFQPDAARFVDEMRESGDTDMVTASEKKVVGFILCNLNMAELPSNKWPRSDQEYQVFVETLVHLVKVKKLRVCLFSHRNKTDSQGNLIPGSDHSIIMHLHQLLPDEIKNEVFLLKGEYDADVMNSLIGTFEMLISGRIHGAVQGIMQYVPTVIIDYGMEPRAHKLKGFALLCGLQEYICDPGDYGDIKEKVDRGWEARERISSHLRERVPTLVKNSQEIWAKIDKHYSSN